MSDQSQAEKRRGRPPYVPKPKDRKTVERMVACGDNQETISRALGIEDDTLRKHFGEELKNGYARKRRQVIDMLFKGAESGNATLIKRVEEMTRLVGAAAEFDRPADEPRTSLSKKLPKKEAVHQDAVAAGEGNEWGEDLKAPADTLPN